MKTTLALAILLCAAGRVKAQDFTLINRTGFPIHSIFISPHDANEWQEDILATEMLMDGQAANVRYEHGTLSKVWDLRAVDKQGAEFTWKNVPLPAIAKITLEMKDGQLTGETE